MDKLSSDQNTYINIINYINDAALRQGIRTAHTLCLDQFNVLYKISSRKYLNIYFEKNMPYPNKNQYLSSNWSAYPWYHSGIHRLRPNETARHFWLKPDLSSNLVTTLWLILSERNHG